MKKIIVLNIQGCEDREKVVTALANSGYFVRVREVEKSWHSTETDYFVDVYEKEKVKNG
jgi:hypothetical protein